MRSRSRGSPPRAWGQCCPALAVGSRDRFTPTGVGTIRPVMICRGTAPVHPHGRGDNFQTQRYFSSRIGSPPRAWGQCEKSAPVGGHTRFTPTGVGTIASAGDTLAILPVHPHGRGDNEMFHQRADRRNGSPPRAWGQCWIIARTVSVSRFTPTGVGTIGALSIRRVVTSVHPHGRGDNISSGSASAFSDGSPPRAWGQCKRFL